MSGAQAQHSASDVAPGLPRADTRTALIYVVGEVLMSILAMAGGFVLVFYSAEESVKLVGSGLLSAVTALWFARRQGEQANQTIAQVSDIKLAQLLELQARQQAQTDTLVTVLARQPPP